MPSYNLVNGRPNHVARELLDEVRGWTTASLFVVSDAGAPTNLVVGERYYDDHVEAAAAAVRAGVDSFTDHDADPTRTIAHLTAALERGLLDQADVDRAALRQLELRLAHRRAGPRPRPVGVGHRRPTSTCPPAARWPARRRPVRSSSCENDGVLPLRPGARVAVVGPHADQVLTDWYSGTPPYTVSIAEALDPVDVVSGADTVALRSRTTGGYVDVGADGILTATARTRGPPRRHRLGRGRPDAPRRRVRAALDRRRLDPARRRAERARVGRAGELPARTGTTTAPSRCSTRAPAGG